MKKYDPRIKRRTTVHSIASATSLVITGALLGCSTGASDDDLITKTTGALTGPSCESQSSAGCWVRADLANQTTFDIGLFMACAVVAGSGGYSGAECNESFPCAADSYIRECEPPAIPPAPPKIRHCWENVANSITCWNRNWVPTTSLPVLSTHIRSVAIGRRDATTMRAVAALTSDGVVRFSTGLAADDLVKFYSGFNTWSASIAPVDSNGATLDLLKIVAITVPSQTAVDTQLLAMTRSGRLYVHSMMTATGPWLPATSVDPWSRLPSSLVWSDISHYDARGGATLLSTTKEIWRVGSAQFNASGVRTFDAPKQLPALPNGLLPNAVGGAFVITNGGDNAAIYFSDEVTFGWQRFEGGLPSAESFAVGRLIVDGRNFSPPSRRNFGVQQVNGRFYKWQDPAYSSGSFWTQDWNTTSDWDSGYLKGTCSTGNTMVGLSSSTSGGTHKVLCRTAGPSDFTANAQYITGLGVVGVDARRANRSAFGTTDWAPGFYKLECGINEFVSGASHAPGSHVFHGIRCSGPSDFTDSRCVTRNLDNGDDRDTRASDDWDAGYYKGECGLNSYVAGVSVSPSTGFAHSLLCCQRTPTANP